MLFKQASKLLAIVALMLMFVVACAPAGGTEPAAPASTVEAATAVPTPQPEATVGITPELRPQNPGEKEHTTAAINDLAERLGVDRATIEVVAYEPITWRDGSLGCPQPDMMYTQALVDGYVVQLSVDGQTFRYHGQVGQDPFLCEN